MLVEKNIWQCFKQMCSNLLCRKLLQVYVHIRFHVSDRVSNSPPS
jgi:hypothetical protein